MCICSSSRWKSIDPCLRSKEQSLLLWKPQNSFSSSYFRTENSPSVCFDCLFVLLAIIFSLRDFFFLQFPEHQLSLLMGSSLWKALSSAYDLTNRASVATALFPPMGSTMEATSGAGRMRASLKYRLTFFSSRLFITLELLPSFLPHMCLVTNVLFRLKKRTQIRQIVKRTRKRKISKC